MGVPICQIGVPIREPYARAWGRRRRLWINLSATFSSVHVVCHRMRYNPFRRGLVGGLPSPRLFSFHFLLRLPRFFMPTCGKWRPLRRSAHQLTLFLFLPERFQIRSGVVAAKEKAVSDASTAGPAAPCVGGCFVQFWEI